MRSAEYSEVSGLKIDTALYDFTESILKDFGYSADEARAFWRGFATIIEDFAPRNFDLLQIRETLQKQIDTWHRDNACPIDTNGYAQFLRDIGYITPEGEDFSISTKNVDAEIAEIAAPQLVVPLKNARFAINACNARWVSLYDSLYGSDIIAEGGGADRTAQYNPKRGEKVIAWSLEFLDDTAPFEALSYAHITAFAVENGVLVGKDSRGKTARLKRPALFAGYTGASANPTSLLLRHHGLHIELCLDTQNRQHVIADINIEAAVSTIMDAEDSVAAVDAEDKCEIYANWLGLMQGSLTAQMQKGGKAFTRTMRSDKTFSSASGEAFTIKGRSLMLVRHMGHLTYSSAILYDGDKPIPEGIMDAVITALIANYDLRDKTHFRNSQHGSIYAVKPKMHGPDEAAFTDDLFNAVEDLLHYPRYTMKIGVMDEERRTSLNLKETIRAVKHRLIFINTGFLDRTGDEIHTCMQAGVMLPIAEMKQSRWIQAYEKNNVAVGLRCGLGGKAQIGKGMWAMPDNLRDMLEQKIAHLEAGASCAWVPSPTAAALHAVHYHRVSVQEVQARLAKDLAVDYTNELLHIPVVHGDIDNAIVRDQLDDCVQRILAYVVRWVNQGIGCSKVPDINNVGLMEDRATLRISSQLIANWLWHGVCSQSLIEASLRRMADIVDKQNADDSDYIGMHNDWAHSFALQASHALIFAGAEQPSGYTEPILYSKRLQFKHSLTD